MTITTEAAVPLAHDLNPDHVERERLSHVVITTPSFRYPVLETAFRSWLQAHAMGSLRTHIPYLPPLYLLLAVICLLRVGLDASAARGHDLHIALGMVVSLGVTTLAFCWCARRPALDRWFWLYAMVTDTAMLAVMTLGYASVETSGLRNMGAAIVAMGFIIVFGMGLLRLGQCLAIAAMAATLVVAVLALGGQLALLQRCYEFYVLDLLGATFLCHVVERTHRLLFLQECTINQDRLRLADLSQRLAELSRRDGLTGLLNRRHFDEALTREWDRARREQAPLSLLFVDVDHFKAYNDALGHQAGDHCLRQVASALDEAARRPGDVVARYGGEEFVLLLPQTAAAGALQTAERALQGLAAQRLPHPRSGFGHVTASIGLATCIPAGAAEPEALVEAADAALYASKAAGRNRVVLAGQESADAALSPT